MTLHAAKILLVDDDVVVAGLLSALLEGAGYGCIIAHKTSEAEKLLAEHRFDIIIIDLMLGSESSIPESGVMLVARLNELGVSLPIIGISGYPFSSGKEIADEAGMTAFLSKPIDHEDLIEAIENILHGRGNGG